MPFALAKTHVVTQAWVPHGAVTPLRHRLREESWPLPRWRLLRAQHHLPRPGVHSARAIATAIRPCRNIKQKHHSHRRRALPVPPSSCATIATSAPLGQEHKAATHWSGQPWENGAWWCCVVRGAWCVVRGNAWYVEVRGGWCVLVLWWWFWRRGGGAWWWYVMARQCVVRGGAWCAVRCGARCAVRGGAWFVVVARGGGVWCGVLRDGKVQQVEVCVSIEVKSWGRVVIRQVSRKGCRVLPGKASSCDAGFVLELIVLNSMRVGMRNFGTSETKCAHDFKLPWRGVWVRRLFQSPRGVGWGEFVVLHNCAYSGTEAWRRLQRAMQLGICSRRHTTGDWRRCWPQAVAEGPQGHPGGRRADVSARWGGCEERVLQLLVAHDSVSRKCRSVQCASCCREDRDVELHFDGSHRRVEFFLFRGLSGITEDACAVKSVSASIMVRKWTRCRTEQFGPVRRETRQGTKNCKKTASVAPWKRMFLFCTQAAAKCNLALESRKSDLRAKSTAQEFALTMRMCRCFRTSDSSSNKKGQVADYRSLAISPKFTRLQDGDCWSLDKSTTKPNSLTQTPKTVENLSTHIPKREEKKEVNSIHCFSGETSIVDVRSILWRNLWNKSKPRAHTLHTQADTQSVCGRRGGPWKKRKNWKSYCHVCVPCSSPTVLLSSRQRRNKASSRCFELFDLPCVSIFSEFFPEEKRASAVFFSVSFLSQFHVSLNFTLLSGNASLFAADLPFSRLRTPGSRAFQSSNFLWRLFRKFDPHRLRSSMCLWMYSRSLSWSLMFSKIFYIILVYGSPDCPLYSFLISLHTPYLSWGSTEAYTQWGSIVLLDVSRRGGCMLLAPAHNQAATCSLSIPKPSECGPSQRCDLTPTRLKKPTNWSHTTIPSESPFTMHRASCSSLYQQRGPHTSTPPGSSFIHAIPNSTFRAPAMRHRVAPSPRPCAMMYLSFCTHSSSSSKVVEGSGEGVRTTSKETMSTVVDRRIFIPRHCYEFFFLR